MCRNMVNKITFKFYHLILIILFSLTTYCSIVSLYYIGGKSSSDDYNPLILLLGVVVLISTLFCYKFILEKFSEKQLKLLSVIIFCFYMVFLLFWGFNLKYIPSYDLIHIHAEAEDMLNTGKISNITYFAKYPSQQPLTIFLYFVFKCASLFGITDFKNVGIILNILAIFVSAVFVFRICSLHSLKSGVLGLTIFVVDPVLYRWVSYYYTDTICIPFMLAGIYIFLLVQNRRGFKFRYGLVGISGFLIMLGGEIRMTAMFAAIALGMHLFIKEAFRDFLKKATFLVAGMLCAFILVNSLVNVYGVSDESYKLPITHWIKLGLNEESYGAYNTKDEKDTLAASTYEEKIQENLDTIDERIEEMGLSGVVSLYSKKLIRTWGTAAYTESLQYTAENYGRLYQYSIGNKSIIYNYWMQIFRCTLLVLIAFGSLVALKKGNQKEMWVFILMFGAIVFYIFWEAKPKYSLCFLPVMYMLAEYAISQLPYNYYRSGVIAVKIENKDFHEKHIVIELNRVIFRMQVIILIFTIAIGMLSYSKYVDKKEEQEDVRVLQTSAWTGKIHEIGYDGIKQSFIASGKFNTIKISFLNPDHLKHQKYYISILDDQGIVIQRKTVMSEDIEDNTMHEFSFDRINSENDKYYIWIKPEQKYEKYIGVNSCRYTLYDGYKNMPDYYLDGELYINGKQQNADLTFVVSNKYTGSRISLYVFSGIFALILVCESIPFVFIYKEKQLERKYKKAK